MPPKWIARLQSKFHAWKAQRTARGKKPRLSEIPEKASMIRRSPATLAQHREPRVQSLIESVNQKKDPVEILRRFNEVAQEKNGIMPLDYEAWEALFATRIKVLTNIRLPLAERLLGFPPNNATHEQAARAVAKNDRDAFEHAVASEVVQTHTRLTHVQIQRHN